MLVPRFLLIATFLTLVAQAGATQEQALPEWQFSSVERIVAIGDVHGAYPQLETLLRQLDLIDAAGRWQGGKTHFVSVGDLLDRGAESRKVMDLLMRLQEEAAAAGGRVLVVPGNHEIMNMTDDLRYVAPGEYAAFAGDETPARRQAAFSTWLSVHGTADEDPQLTRQRFDAAYPLGFFAHRQAFSLSGRYGRWLAGLPFLIKINDTVFVHGGLSVRLAGKDGAAINRQMQLDLENFLAQSEALQRRGWFDAFADYDERFISAMDLVAAADSAPGKPEARVSKEGEPATPAADGGEAAVDEDKIAAMRAYQSLQSALPFAPDGPLWYRGNAWCHELWEPLRLAAVLDGLGARRVVFGHTPTVTRRITQRLDGRALMVDTGMLPYYEGRPSALEITRNGLQAYYADEERWAELTTDARRIGARPAALTDGELEAFLASADIVNSEELGMGVTKPLRLTLEQDGVTLRAIFKGEDTDISGGSGSRFNQRANIVDSYKHDIAAYRLDKFLGIDLVPVTIEREFDGRSGALQFWVEDAVSTFEMREKNIPVYPVCDVQEQYDLMRVLDILIFNEDRNQTNVLFEKERGLVRLIDHSRAFRTHRGRPASFKDSRIRMPAQLAQRLRALDRETLHELIGDYVGRKQMRALLKRRDEILRDAEILSDWPDPESVAD